MYNLATAQGRRLLVLTLGLITALGPMAIDLYLPALPAIAQEMGEPLGRIQLTLSAYTIGLALGQIIFGPMSDRFGRMKIMLPGIVGYIVTNLLASMASSANELILIRVLQALSGSAVAVCIPAMVRDMFPKQECARILSSILLVMTMAPLIAPVIGGQILKFQGWESLFLFLSALGCVAFALAFFRLSESLAPDNRLSMRPADIRRAYWNILSHKKAMSYILAHGFFFGGMFAFISGSPFVYIELFGVPAEHYGYLFALNIVMLAICNIVNMQLMRHFDLKTLLLVGCGIACVAGLVLLVNTSIGFGGLAGVVVPCMMFVGMMSFSGPNANTLTLELFPQSAGTANAAAGVMRFGLGGITAGLAGILHDGTAVPMAAIMAGCGILAVICLIALGGLRHDEDHIEDSSQNTDADVEPLKAA